MTNKGLISKTQKKLTQLDSKKVNKLIKKTRTDQTFSQRHTQANRHRKRCPTLLIIRVIQIKTTMKYHLIPVRMAIVKKTTNKCWEGCEEKGTLVHCW